MRNLLLLALPLAVTGSALAQTTFNETEPNNSKATANAFTLAPGDKLAGTTTGSSTTATGSTSLDYFRLSFGSAAPGVYLNELAIAPLTSGAFIGTLRGVTQTNGTINATEIAVQTSSIAETNNSRVNRFYSFGADFSVNYRIAGSTSTTSPYDVTYTRTAVAVESLGTFNPGAISFSTRNPSEFADPSVVLYDSNFQPIFANEDATADDLNASFTRTLAAGTYTLAISNFSLKTNQAADPSDGFRDASVLDGPNFLVASNGFQNDSFDFSLTGGATTVNRSFSQANKFQAGFYSFTVAQPVPEPASMAALALGAAALLRGRRKA